MTQQLTRHAATRGEEYKCVAPCIVCLLITLLSLIPIMSGAGLCSDSVTGMTAGLVLIRNDHRPGYKHAHTQPSHIVDHLHKQTSAHLRHLCLQPEQQHSLICKPDCSLGLLVLATIRACHLWLRTFVSSKQEKTAWLALQMIRLEALNCPLK